VAASAQTVYSVNSVGYINLSIPPGFSTFANQLKTADNTLDDLFPTPPNGMQVFSWNGTAFDAYEAVDVGGPVLWTPDGALSLDIGTGYFINNPTAAAVDVTLVGEVPQGTDSNITLAGGFSMVGATVPQSGDVIDGMGFPTSAGDQIFQWNGSAYDVYEAIDVGGPVIWAPSNPNVAVGEGFFVNKIANFDWNRDFSVNN
jgi:hypothetical protein